LSSILPPTFHCSSKNTLCSTSTHTNPFTENSNDVQCFSSFYWESSGLAGTQFAKQNNKKIN
jgi:hypothetical protein